MENKNIWAGLLVVLVIAIGAYFYPTVRSSLGAIVDTSYFDFFDATTGYKINGTTVLSSTSGSGFVATTCNILANVSITATSSGRAFCTGVTGVTSGTKIIAQFSTTTSALAADQWVIVGSQASSTAGAIEFELLNLTGGNAIPAAVSTRASSTKIWAFN